MKHVAASLKYDVNTFLHPDIALAPLVTMQEHFSNQQYFSMQEFLLLES